MYLMTKFLKPILVLLNRYRSRCFVIKYIIDDDDDDKDYKADYSCNSVNFKVRTTRFFMELNINNI